MAIAGAESSFGTQWVNCPQSGFNAWSWFYRRTCQNSPSTSFADGIQRVTSGIRRLYFNHGFETIPAMLEGGYCVTGCGSWVANVTNFYTAQGGNTEDLTFHIGLIDFEQFTPPFAFGSAQPPLKVFAKINGTVSRNPADSATISGGSLVNAATFLPVDQSVVYGTKFTCEGCLPAMTIQFAHKVSNFSVFLMNGIDVTVTYIVEDDQGGMQTKTLAANFDLGGATVMLPETGIRQVTVMPSSSVDNWDFFIDNIRFSPD